MALFDALCGKNYAVAHVGDTKYTVKRAIVFSEGGRDNKAAGFVLMNGIVPVGEYPTTDDIEEVCRNTSGTYSTWKYADWH